MAAADGLHTVGTPSYTRRAMSVLQERPSVSELELAYSKRLMLVSGRANPELASRIADKLGVDHHQQLHQRVIGPQTGASVLAGGLDYEYVRAAYGLVEPAVDLAGREGLERHVAELDPEPRRDRRGQIGIRPAREQHELLAGDDRLTPRRTRLLAVAHPASVPPDRGERIPAALSKAPCSSPLSG